MLILIPDLEIPDFFFCGFFSAFFIIFFYSDGGSSMGAWCQLHPTRDLPFSFALSHSAEYATRDSEGAGDGASTAHSAWPPGQPKRLLVCPIVLRGSKTSKTGQCLVPQDNSPLKPAACCPVCHEGVAKTWCDRGGIPSGDFWRMCSRMPHHELMTIWL